MLIPGGRKADSAAVVPLNRFPAESEAVGAGAGKDELRSRTADEAEAAGGRAMWVCREEEPGLLASLPGSIPSHRKAASCGHPSCKIHSAHYGQLSEKFVDAEFRT